MFQISIDSGLSIRLLMRKDASQLFQLIDQCRNDLRQWFSWVDSMQTKSDCVEVISRWLVEFASETAINVGIFEHDRLVGIVGVHHFDYVNKKTSLGYWLGVEHRGKGMMTKAVKKMVEMAFVDYGMNRVEIRCAVENRPSRRIPERLSFHREGTLRSFEKIRDEYKDHVVYSLLKKDFVV